jgi:hypothetical protein
MNVSYITQGLGVALLASLVTTGHAAPGVMRDAATHDQLSLALRKADQLDPMKNLAPATGEDPSMKNRPKDILTESDIISYRGLATLVPKRAILQIPKKYEGQIKMEAGSKIVGWADFYTANRSWITTIEVSRVQAEGNEPVAEETQKVMAKSTNLIVATYKGGPISVLPLKVPVTDTTKPPVPDTTVPPATDSTKKP